MNMFNRKETMRRKALLFLALMFLVVSAAKVSTAAPPVNDRVIIQKRKLTIVRTGKLARQFPERRRATINMPVISGLKPLAVLNKVRSHLALKNIFDTSLAEYRRDAWLTEFDYTVNYNKNSILDITFMQSGVGAYPDTHVKHVVINLKNGDIMKARDVFKPASLAALSAMVDEKLQTELRSILKDGEGRSDLSAEDRQRMREMYGGLKFEASNLDDFQVGDAGVTFLFDAGFPHAVQAFEPEGKYFFSYAELAPHISPGSLLANLVK